MISLVVLLAVLGAVAADHQRYYPAAAFPYHQVAPLHSAAAFPYNQVAPLHYPHAVPQYSAYSPVPYSVNSLTPVVKAVAPVPAYSSPVVKPVAILRQSLDNNFDGTFSYDFQGENGISNQASGYVKAISPKEQAQVMQGEYSYTTPDGTPITTRWYADETGFHAEGAHLPVSPALPEAIAKSLARQAL